MRVAFSRSFLKIWRFHLCIEVTSILENTPQIRALSYSWIHFGSDRFRLNAQRRKEFANQLYILGIFGLLGLHTDAILAHGCRYMPKHFVRKID